MEVLGFPGQALGLQSLTSVTNGMTINLRRNEEATGQNDLSPPPHFSVCRRTLLWILSDPLTRYLSSCALTLLGRPQGSCQSV